MNKITYSLLIGALLLGFNQSALAFDPYKGAIEQAQGAAEYAKAISRAEETNETKLGILSRLFEEQVYKRAIAESFVNWLVEGIKRAVSASPIEIQDSIPPNMENADIPEFLVKQLQNPSAKGSSVGLKSNELMVVFSMPISKEEYRKNRDYDEFVNLFLNKGGANMHFEDPNGVIKK